jgi:hypothetical protein
VARRLQRNGKQAADTAERYDDVAWVAHHYQKLGMGDRDGIELMASIARTSRFMISRMEETLSDYSLGLSQYLVLMTVLLSECLVDWLRRVGSPRPDLIIPPRCRRRRH